MRLIKLEPFIFAALIAIPAAGQNRYTLTPPSVQVDRTIALDLGGGATFHVAMEHYPAGDSSHVELLWTDQDQQTTNARCYRLSTPMSYLQDAARTNDGFLVCGMADVTTPFLLKTDTQGDAQWQMGYPSLPFAQQALATVLAGPDGLRAYSTGTSITAGSCRIQGDGSGSNFQGVTMQAPVTALFQTAGATAMNGGDLVFGQGALTSNANDRRMFMMRADSTGAQWAKLYDLDAASWWNEYTTDVEVLADGYVLAVGYASDGGAGMNGYVMKLDTTGAVQWCRKCTDASGVLVLKGAIELPGGELLVAGNDDDETLIILRLDPAGMIIAQYQLPAGFHQPNNFFQDDLGGLVLMEHDTRHELDATASGCDFLTNASVVSTLHVPVITTLAMTNTNLTPVAVPLTYDLRPPVLGWAADCLSTGEAEPDRPALMAYPNPTSDRVWFGEPGQVASTERLELFDAMGAKLFDGPCGAGVDLTRLPQGVYTCIIPARGIHQRIIRQ